jgi:hypothetical protein
MSFSRLIAAPSGAGGEGVPVGGTAGQVLAKTSATDFATAWVTPHSGDPADLPPVSANAADDEFGTGSLDTAGTRFAGATAWAWNNQGGTAIAPQGYSRLAIVETTSSMNLRIVNQALPAGDWTYECKITGYLLPISNTTFGGMVLRENATGRCETFAIDGTSAGNALVGSRWNTVSSFTSNIGARVISLAVVQSPGYYLRISRVGATITMDYSPNRVHWMTYASYAQTAFFTTAPSHIGLFVYNNAGAFPVVASFDWFRRTA